MWFFGKKYSPRFARWAFLDLILLFAVIYWFDPKVGLAGLGALLMLAAILIEANKDYIWQEYKAGFKKLKKAQRSVWNEPKDIYYQVNVYFLWPLVFLVGLYAVWAAILG